MTNDKAQMTNQIQNSNNKYDLEERTALFAEKIIRFCKSIKKDEISRPLVSQLVRASTSIGANYNEADGCESKKDFQYKISLCKKESKETKHWLRMISTYSIEHVNECKVFQQEAKELTLIFSKIIINCKNNKFRL